jgi:O6-methylguanine-DNA--protein-cysteine methyltransferase
MRILGMDSGGKMISKDTEKKLKKSFKRVKQELDDHRESINENTNEIQTNYEYLCQIDSKIEKLSSRIDEMQYLFEKILSTRKDQDYTIKDKLTLQEQEIFLLLYTLEEGQTLTFSELTAKTGLETSKIKSIMDNIAQKGVQIKIFSIDKLKGFSLDPDFKDYQAKNNIVEISDKLVKYLGV